MNQSNASLLLATVIVMDLLAGLEFDLFVPSFPELQQQFNLSPFWTEALLSVNFVGFCLSLFVVGIFSDRYGRKPIIVLGLLIFVLGSGFCLWAPSYLLLIVGRFLQGIGIAAPTILSFLIIADFYPIKRQQFLTAMLNGVMNASVAIAPVIGSHLTIYFYWQGNFAAMLLLGLATLAMTVLFVPNYQLPQKETSRFQDYVVLFSTKPLVLLMLCFVVMFVPYWIFVGVSPLLYLNDFDVSLSHFGFYQGALALILLWGVFYTAWS